MSRRPSVELLRQLQEANAVRPGAGQPDERRITIWTCPVCDPTSVGTVPDPEGHEKALRPAHRCNRSCFVPASQLELALSRIGELEAENERLRGQA